jgi:hypothetical protein
LSLRHPCGKESLPIKEDVEQICVLKPEEVTA